MKKITLFVILLLPFVGFSQSNSDKIQSFLESKHASLGLTRQDVSDISVISEVYAEGTKITSCYVAQQYQGTPLFNVESNFWIKDGEVINVQNTFLNNIAQRVNATSPSLQMIPAITAAYVHLGITASPNFSIVETINSKKFLLTDGLQEDRISARLVYQPMPDSSLKLAWAFQFYTPNASTLWDIRIDALDGKVLQKHNLTISCSFGDNDHKNHGHETENFNFVKEAFKSETSMLEVNSGTYRVIPYNYTSPDHSPFQVIASPHDVVASPYGWHNFQNNGTGTGTQITSGNNVWAQEDTNGDNGTGASPNGGTALNFVFPYGGKSAQPSSYIDAATTNLFYMNNMMHDVWYRYGFNEISGNFQRNNYGNGGVGGFPTGDYVLADSQDGSGVDNANFSTPPDGSRPRMQMFLFSSVAPPIFPLTILAPSDIAGPRQARDNVFDPGHVPIPIAPNGIESDLVLYDDGTPDPGTTDNADGCGPAVNAAAINGKITVIRRSLAEESGGTPCAFIEKVKNAQNAGATAVIIVNNIPGSPTLSPEINMSGADATITIPAISLTQAVGEALIARMKLETVRGRLELPEPPYVAADGSFDNTVIAHEYGHGISNRLIGGPTNTSCMTNYDQMGEGWSDWFGLMMQIKQGDTGADPKPIGTFVTNESVVGFGFRQYPYSTDMSVNPLTLADSNIPIPSDPQNTSYRYVAGDMWSTVLWDLTWNYITKYGFDPNLQTGTGGNNKVMRLVLDALKLQACNQSSMINSRDMLIAADLATTGGADYCMITETFRRRGMGLNASSGSADNPNDQVEDFTAFPAGANCTLAANEFNNDESIRVYPNPSNGQITIRINQYSGTVNFQIIDINGRVVYTANDTDFNVEKTISLDHLQSGMYIMKVDGESLNYVHKIILN